MTFGQPPRRRKAFSCSSAQVRTLDRQASRRTALRIAHHRTAAVVDLPFFSWSRDDDARWFRPLRSAQPANIALHRLIAPGKAVVRDQVLPNRLAIAT